MSFLSRWLASPSRSLPKTTHPRFRPALQVLDDRITPTFGFSTQQSFTVGTNPQSLVAADFNGDGLPDLVTSNYASNTVSVLLDTSPAGASSPTFATQQSFSVGTNPISVATGDLNGDGRPDVVAADFGTGKVSVLLNTTPTGTSSPTFATQQTFTVGTNPAAVAIGDFNGDGRPDIVTANQTSNTVSVLLNTTPAGSSTPTFSTQQTFTVGSSPYSVALADFNGDGRLDIVAANDGGGIVSVLLNTTTSGATIPTFTTQQTFTVGSGPDSVAVGDFNGDGRPDIVTANYGSNNVSVLLNTTAAGASSAAFATQQTFSVGSGPTSVAVGDFNGDGRSDITATNYNSNSVSVLLNTTTAGTFTPTFSTQQPTFTVGSSPYSVAIADFNGDGRLDLASANYGSNAVSVLLNSTTDSFATTTPALVGQFSTTGVWAYNRVLGQWVNLTQANANALATAPNGNIVASFGGNGVWYYRPATGWVQINGVQASALAIDQYGNAYINFGPAYGTYQYNLATNNFVQLAGTSAGADKLVVSSNGDVIANFSGFGVFRFRWTTGWQQINGYYATSLSVDPNGYVVASFNGFGVGQYIPYANGWRTLAFSSASAVTTDGSGNVYASFAGFGIGRWSSATSTWTNLAPSAIGATSLAADLFGNVYMELIGYGVYEYNPTTGWHQRNNTDANFITLGR